MTKPRARAEWTSQAVNGVLADLPAAALASTRRFGRYQARSLDTSYTAVTDGFVLAGVAPSHDVSGLNLAILQGLVDGNLVASATAGNFGCFDSNWNYMRAAGTSSFLMPVPKGATWQVAFIQHQGSQGAIGSWVNWMPLGADASEVVSEMAAGQRLDAVTTVSKPWEDFEPAMGDLVDVLGGILKQSFTDQEKRALLKAIKRLI
ncbi:MAG TPA: hypothetical protein VIT23_02840 [Terrimicrobiaceae bacterium]